MTKPIGLMSEEPNAEAAISLAILLRIVGPKVVRKSMLYKVEGADILTALCADRSTRSHGTKMEPIQSSTVLGLVIVVHSSINHLMREQNT